MRELQAHPFEITVLGQVGPFIYIDPNEDVIETCDIGMQVDLDGIAEDSDIEHEESGNGYSSERSKSNP